MMITHNPLLKNYSYKMPAYAGIFLAENAAAGYAKKAVNEFFLSYMKKTA